MQTSQVLTPQSQQTIPVWTSLCERGHCHAATGKGLHQKCCHKVGSTELSRMSLYAVALRFLFTETKGPCPNHEKQPQTIIPPPPNFTVGALHWGRFLSSDCQIVKRDLSLQVTHFHCSRVQWQRALHHSSQHLALQMVILCLLHASALGDPIL